MKYDQIIDVRLLAPLATSVAIMVSIVLWLLNQRRKQLSYRVLWQDTLVRARSQMRDRMDILFDGKSIEDAGLLIVQILNSGHLPISPGDYHSRLTISAGPGAKVVFADVTATTPGDLEARCRTADGEKRNLIEAINESEVVLAPILLNEGDSVTVQVLTQKMRGGVKVSGHINGVRKVAPYRPSSVVAMILINSGALIMAASTLMFEPSSVVRFGISEGLPAILFFLFGYTLLSAGMTNRQKVASASTLETVI